MLDDKITPVSTTSPRVDQLPTVEYNNELKLKLLKIPLKQNKAKYKRRPIVNIYIVYKLITSPINIGVTLHNCLFGVVKLTKNADIDKYKYSGYGIGFDSRGSFTHPSGGYGRNVIIFGADLSSSKHVNNKGSSILVLGRDFIQGIDF